jgi:hypothetical protein
MTFAIMCIYLKGFVQSVSLYHRLSEWFPCVFSSLLGRLSTVAAIRWLDVLQLLSYSKRVTVWLSVLELAFLGCFLELTQWSEPLVHMGSTQLDMGKLICG